MPAHDAAQILVNPLQPALIHGVAQTLPVLVRVQAPDAPDSPATTRAPYHLAFVIDRSGSMAGAPLQQAVRCVRHMVDRLLPTDIAALVVFDDRVKTLVTAAPVGDRTALDKALLWIHEGGNTNLHGGWQAGADELVAQASQAALARVILLSDGNANSGELRETEPIAACCAEAATKGVSTSTYGLGRSFNEDLMVAMAEKGKGNYYYGDTAEDLLEPFTEEFDLISNLFARQVRLSLGVPAAAPGIGITLINDYPQENREGFPLIHLPDLPYGAEAWALVELAIPAEVVANPGSSVTLLQAGVTAASLEGTPVAFADVMLALPVVSATEHAALVADALVQSRHAELHGAEWMLRVRQLAADGDWTGIEALMADGRERFRDVPWVQAVIEELDHIAASGNWLRFRKEALYASKKMSGRLSAKEELLGIGLEHTKASYLRRKSAQGKAGPNGGSQR